MLSAIIPPKSVPIIRSIPKHHAVSQSTLDIRKNYEGSTIILGHAIAEMSHDNHVRMVCIDTYEEYTVCFINGVANIHIDLDNIIRIGAE